MSSMYPNQPEQPNQPQYDYSVDYLNQISAPAKTSRGPSPKVLGLIIAGLIALLAVVGGLLIFGNQTTPTDKATDLYLRMQTLQEIAENQHKHLRDNGLRSTNSSYSLFLTNAIRDLEAPLESAGVNLKKLPQDSSSAEAAFSEDLTSQFDEARLNVVLDRTYAREMAYQLDVLHSIMISIYSSTSSQALKDYLETTEKNLAAISESFSEFSATK